MGARWCCGLGIAAHDKAVFLNVMKSAKLQFEDDRFEGVRVLLVGSGADLAGRRLGRAVDCSRRWDVVARCNKFYGAPVDVGYRCEVAFIRWRHWLFERAAAPGVTGGEWWPPAVRCGVRRVVVLNEFQGVSEAECRAVAREVGVERASCGVLAAAWLLNRGARVEAIGMGWDGSAWAAAKSYGGRAQVDKNEHYDWGKEHRWWESSGVRLL